VLFGRASVFHYSSYEYVYYATDLLCIYAFCALLRLKSSHWISSKILLLLSLVLLLLIHNWADTQTEREHTHQHNATRSCWFVVVLPVVVPAMVVIVAGSGQETGDVCVLMNWRQKPPEADSEEMARAPPIALSLQDLMNLLRPCPDGWRHLS